VFVPDDEIRLGRMWHVELPLGEQQYKLLVRAAQAVGCQSVDDWMRATLVTEASRVLGTTENDR
jgi:uncharacterized protein (DUF1778 family)